MSFQYGYSFLDLFFPNKNTDTMDTEIKAKRNNIISGLITFRITKEKAKAKLRAKYRCGHECERSSVPINIESESDGIFLGIYFTLESVSTVLKIIPLRAFNKFWHLQLQVYLF